MKQRIGWVDVVKGISMVCVMLSHSGMGRIGPHIGTFFVPIFFFISGFTFSPEKFTSIRDLLKNKGKRLLQPYVLFFLILFLIYNLPFGWDMKDSLIGFFKATSMNAVLSPLWFLPALFFMSVIYYFLYRISRKPAHLFMMSIFCSLLGYLFVWFRLPLMLWTIDSVLSCMIFFCAGNLIKSLDLSRWYRWYYFILLLVVNISIACTNGGATISIREFGKNYLLFYIGAFSGIWVYTIAAMWIDRHVPQLSGLLTYIGTNTLIFLALHRLVFTLDMLIFTRLPVISSFILSIEGSFVYGLLQTGIAIVCLTPLVWLINKEARFLIGL